MPKKRIINFPRRLYYPDRWINILFVIGTSLIYVVYLEKFCSMVRFLLLVILLCGSVFAGAQEFCFNGIDDDGDGLIDLNDPTCVCNGIFSITNQTDKIPNPSFEEVSCCPTNFAELNCLNSWESVNAATPDYNNDCDWYVPAIDDYGLLPFPDGKGVAGMVFYGWHQESVKTCLNAPLQPYTTYDLSLFVAGMSINDDGTACSGSNFGAVEVTLYGSTGCNLPAAGVACPPQGNPAWVVLGSAAIFPNGTWQKININFTPTTQIIDIAIGCPCNPPPQYNIIDPCLAYFLIDGLELMGEESVDEIEIFTIGSPCTYDFALDAFVEHFGGGYQWFYNGVAILGQNSSYFELAANNYQSGTYQVVYTAQSGCVMDSITVTIPDFPDTLVIENFICPEASVECGGETLGSPGTYDIVLSTDQGCDSMVTCIVEEYVLVPVTEIVIDTCGPATFNICDQQATVTGFYTFVCQDYRGCDSIVTLDLQILSPEVIIMAPLQLTCDSGSVVTLDGSLSSVDAPPDGSVEYKWSGPPGGIPGDKDGEIAYAYLPGTYCLEIIMAINGRECRDTACVTVTINNALLPDAPIISGPITGCIGDSLAFNFTNPGDIAANAYAWILPVGKPLVILNDSSLLFFPDSPGVDTFCAVLYNECGVSDTSCHIITVAPSHFIELFSTTCDPAEAGVFQSDLMNQFGCDSIIVSTVTLNPTDLLVIPQTTCDPAQAGSDTLFLTNQFNCDSTVIIQTTLLPSHIEDVVLFTCDPGAAVTDTFFLTNQFGCDSTVFYSVIYSGNYVETNQAILCGVGNNYADTLVIQTGPCDSLFITDYTYISPDTTLLSDTTCDPAQAGVDITVLQNIWGCDSTIIEEILLQPSDNTFESLITCDANQAGTQVFTLVNQFGCDSIHTIETVYMGIDTMYLQDQTCDPAKAGTAVVVIPGTFCDTVQVIETILVTTLITTDSVFLCGESATLSDTLFLQGADGCDSLSITVRQFEPIIAIPEVLGESCLGDGDGQIIINQVTGAVEPLTYQLVSTGTWQPDPAFDNLTPGNYTVLVQDSRGCVDTLTGLTVSDGIVLVLDAGPDLEIEYGTEVFLNGTANQPLTSLQWTAVNPVVCPTCLSTQMGPVLLSQTVGLTGTTSSGCIGEDQFNIVVIQRELVYIPTSFSPNFDGINDIFSVYGNQFAISVRNLAIYDRWGNSLFLQEDLPINDPSVGWDGHYKSKLMDPGVYVYVVEVVLSDGSTKVFKGDVTLVR